MPRETFDVQQVALEWYHSDFPVERMPDFAVWALRNGRALREFAGLTSATRTNDTELIERVFRELDVHPMSYEEAADRLILATCNQIVTKQIAPYSGRRELSIASSTSSTIQRTIYVGWA